MGLVTEVKALAQIKTVVFLSVERVLSFWVLDSTFQQLLATVQTHFCYNYLLVTKILNQVHLDI